MKYISIVRWRDLDDHHLYGEGEEYPFDGREVSEERLSELTGAQNKAGFALIKAVETVEEEKPVQTDETPKSRGRGRKKTAE